MLKLRFKKQITYIMYMLLYAVLMVCVSLFGLITIATLWLVDDLITLSIFLILVYIYVFRLTFIEIHYNYYMSILESDYREFRKRRSKCRDFPSILEFNISYNIWLNRNKKWLIALK